MSECGAQRTTGKSQLSSSTVESLSIERGCKCHYHYLPPAPAPSPALCMKKKKILSPVGVNRMAPESSKAILTTA